ncbi:MAG: PD-(D/E)XK nuclease family protein [Clostridia bacterium]
MMGIRYITGRQGAIRGAIKAWLTQAMGEADESPVLLVVPAQLTLQAELDALSDLAVPGSFRLQVFSPARLCARVFEQAGGTGRTVIDEQGRVMLMHTAAVKLRKQLCRYHNAVARPGFAERAVRQIAAFKQSGIDVSLLHEAVRGQADPALAGKLSDLAKLFEAYERSLEGLFMDGEDQIEAATARMGGAPFLRGSRVCVYGFDLISPSLTRLILGMGAAAESVTIALVAPETSARDAHLFEPARHTLERLRAQGLAAGLSIFGAQAADDAPCAQASALRTLERELFCVPQRPFEGQARDVQMVVLENPQAEAEFAAALTRKLARTRGWRYRDVAIALASPSKVMEDALRRAFALYGIPLFLASGRPADRHPLAVALMTALKCVLRGYAASDMALYIETGFAGVDGAASDQLVNYAIEKGLRGRRWLRPFEAAEQAELEAARARVLAPLEALKARSKAATSTRAVLEAVYRLLEDVGAYETLEKQRVALEQEGLGTWAMEGAQVWKRVLEALDQMAELLDGAALGLADVYEHLRRALSAATVKALPQAGDAVEGGALEHLKGKPVKALLLVGASDAGGSSPSDLLSEREMSELGEGFRGAWLSEVDKVRMRKAGLKALLALTGAYLAVTRSQSDETGRAVKASALFAEIERVLPRVPVHGITDAPALRAMRLESPEAAFARLPALLGSGEAAVLTTYAALRGMDELAESVQKMQRSFSHKVTSEALPVPLSRKLLGPLAGVSASRLERFAACPFRHFVHYALRPDPFEPFALSPRDAGSFYHEALEAFVRENGAELSELTPEESRARMDAITQRMIEQVLETATSDSAVASAQARKMRTVARRAASIITRQFDGSKFRPVGIEADIDTCALKVSLDETSDLAGRIDRVDVWDSAAGPYVRVIDYKTGGRTVSLQEIYYGLQIQLIAYLTAAMKARSAQPAGVFYFDVSDPLIETAVRDAAIVEQAREKKLRLNGLVLRDAEVVRAMAAQPELAVNVAFNQDGTLRAGERVIEKADFERLIARTLENVEAMLARMRAGDTQIAPFELGNKSPCKYCEYGTICAYDANLPGATPRRLKPMSGKQVLAALTPAQDEAP